MCGTALIFPHRFARLSARFRIACSRRYFQDITLSVASCEDADCATATVGDVASVINEDVVSGSMVLGLDGDPRIVYVDQSTSSYPTSGSLHFVQCTSATCSGETDTNIGTAQSGFSVDVAVGSDGFGRVAFEDPSEQADFIQCTNADCSANSQASNLAQLGWLSPVYIGVDGDGIPGIAVADDVEYVSCTTPNCSDYDVEAMPQSMTDTGMGMTFDADGLPRMIAQDSGGMINYLYQKAGLSCSTPINRGSTATCRVKGGSEIAGWKFADENANPPVQRSTNVTNSTWSGTMATSGTVTVSFANGPDKTASISLKPRKSFAFTTVPASQRTNPYSAGACNISVPTSPAGGNAVGYSCLDQQFSETPFLIGGDGPNHGFRYVYSASNTYNNVSTTFNFIIAGYLDDASSDFAQKQCGNYDPNTNTGFILYTQLKSNTYEHESGSTTGHYATYKSVQDGPTNNIGVALEAVVGPPGQSETDFNDQARSLGNSKGDTINSAAFPVPENFCNSDVRYDPACSFKGNINWPVYATCP